MNKFYREQSFLEKDLFDIYEFVASINSFDFKNNS